MKNLKSRIFFSMIISLVLGMFVYIIGKEDRVFQTYIISHISIFYKLFIFIMQVTIIPMVALTIINSARMITKSIKNDRLGNLTLFVFAISTFFAILIATIISLKLSSGLNFSLDSLTRYTNNIFTNTNSSKFYWIISESLGSFISKFGFLMTILCSFFIGILLELSQRKEINKLKKLIEKTQFYLSEILKMIIKIIFVPVFAYSLVVFSLLGLNAVKILFFYGLFLIFILFVFVISIYTLMIKFFSNIKISVFYKNIKPLWNVVYSNPNSNEVLPVTFATTINKFEINEKITEFVLDMGRKMNRHGTAIMQCMCVVVMSKVYGVHMGGIEIIFLIILVFLMAQGTFLIPFDGIITMTILFQFYGIPIESIFLILGIDKTLESLRTSINVIGDVVCAAVVDKKINK